MNDSNSIPTKNTLPNKKGILDIFGGGIRLILIGAILLYLADFIDRKYLDLIYPYITPSMLLGITIWSIIGFIIPGVLFTLVCKWGKYLETPNLAQIPIIIRILMISASIGACISILGIRTGTMIILNLRNPKDPTEMDAIGKAEQLEYIPNQAFKVYRLYVGAGGFNLLVWGLFFYAIIEFIQVITVDLAYPTLSQTLLTVLDIWIRVCMLTPGILLIVLGISMRYTYSQSRQRQFQWLIYLGGILAIGSIFGLSIGIKLFTQRWMIKSTPISNSTQ